MPTYAGFLSYRVAADKDTAEKMYWRLTSKGMKLFWDRACLENGVPWSVARALWLDRLDFCECDREDGFIHGLKQSNRVVVLISAQGTGCNPTQAPISLICFASWLALQGMADRACEKQDNLLMVSLFPTQYSMYGDRGNGY